MADDLTQDDIDYGKMVAERVGKIAPLLAGMGEAQGAVLADLVAMWLAGHMVPESPGDPAADAMRRAIFETWAKAMWEFVPINEDVIRERHGLPRKPTN